MREHGIPIYLNASIKEARGKGEVEEIDVLQHDEMMSIGAYLICMDGGRTCFIFKRIKETLLPYHFLLIIEPDNSSLIHHYYD
ncbi:hypothetical protein [Fictibacillus sp. NRS-1165]|uniref:hypothetical protein n=1 Tax=Fictibacillus sp. NRS-1165 TaxID=3144463 RepID=UPI003D2110E7